MLTFGLSTPPVHCGTRPFCMARDVFTGRVRHIKRLASTNQRRVAGRSLRRFCFFRRVRRPARLIVFMLLRSTVLAVAAVYVLRRTLPNAVRPHRVGYPSCPLFLVERFTDDQYFDCDAGKALAGLGSSPLAFHSVLICAAPATSSPGDWFVSGEAACRLKASIGTKPALTKIIALLSHSRRSAASTREGATGGKARGLRRHQGWEGASQRSNATCGRPFIIDHGYQAVSRLRPRTSCFEKPLKVNPKRRAVRARAR